MSVSSGYESEETLLSSGEEDSDMEEDIAELASGIIGDLFDWIHQLDMDVNVHIEKKESQKTAAHFRNELRLLLMPNESVNVLKLFEIVCQILAREEATTFEVV
jgi:hypothetical protein